MSGRTSIVCNIHSFIHSASSSGTTIYWIFHLALKFWLIYSQITVLWIILQGANAVWFNIWWQATLVSSHFLCSRVITYWWVLRYINTWIQYNTQKDLLHSDYICSASSSPLLLRCAPDTARILWVSRRSATTGNCERTTCPRSLRGSQSGIRTHDPSDERRWIYQWATLYNVRAL